MEGVLRTQGLCGDFSKMPSSTGQQTKEALEKLDGILSAAGLERKNLIAITIYIADISPENFEEMNQVYDQWVDPDTTLIEEKQASKQASKQA